MMFSRYEFEFDAEVKFTKKVEELNESKLPIVKIDKSLNKYQEKVLFKKKVEKADEALRIIGLPKAAQKSEASSEK